MCADGRAKKTIWGQFWSAEQVSTIIMIMTVMMMTITIIISVLFNVTTNNITSYEYYVNCEHTNEMMM